LDDLRPGGAGSAWSGVDDPAEWREFSRAVAGREGVWDSFLAIEGMYCPACSLTVEDALLRTSGVVGVQVNGATATAKVTWKADAGKPSDWFAALKSAGYTGVPAGDLLTGTGRAKAQRMLLWRWLVAGFCMMQVMMYAVPAYVAAPGEMTPDVVALMRWASWILTLPVLLFSCRPFLQAAWRDVKRLRAGMDVPVAIGILVAFFASTAATFDAGGMWGSEVWFDSITMFVFFLLSGRLLEQRLRDRTAGSLEALVRRLPETVDRQGEGGEFEPVSVRQLAAGDRIRVLAGQAFPADGSVVEGDTTVDEALLTGESHALDRAPGSHVIAGSHNLTASVIVRVDRVGAQTRFAEIVALMEQASGEKPQAQQVADRVAAWFLWGILAASAGAAAWWWASGPSHALGVAVAVLIVTCPCALSLAAPAATLASAGALARRGVLVRRLQALEACADVDTVVFDKTGTLTLPSIALVGIQTRSGTTATQALALAATLARHSLHPVSRALVAQAPAAGWAAQSVVEVAGLGVRGQLAGEGGWGARELRLGSAAFCGVPVSKQGGASQVHLADADGWLATFDLDEALRADALQAVGTLQRMRMRLQLLSGDHARAVRRLAWRAGIASAWGAQSPEDKLEHVRELQHGGHRVLMVGDGLNDGPVLARADVSVAIGQAVPLAQARSDFVVLGGQLAAVPSLIAHARRTRTVMRQNLGWAAAYNAICVPLAMAGWMPPWLAGLGMAASSLLVVANSARLARLSRDF
jgi:P-type Cu2+ transporter